MSSHRNADSPQDISAEPEVRNREGYRIEEPIAVVGMACRFPGGDGLDGFWRLLEAGENAVTEGVPGSGVGRIGEMFADAAIQGDACRFAAFIDDVDQFDPSFFRISPLEAQLLDPQQRLMLEMSWMALEDAGIDPDELRGSRTGVYGGVTHSDYKEMTLDVGDTAAGPASSLYAASGTSNNTAVGRVAFALGLQGPAMAIDTACSSSLVAVHQAVAGLRQDEADLALAGGVNVMLSGRVMGLRAGAGMLAPDGRCKTFDASANGYVRGEGCGIMVLKRLSDAEADGDRIWGVIRGSALNQDGATSGLTVPNEEAQEQVIRDALRRSGVMPSQVDYVEAHGTGTPVGDPIELQAIASVYSEGRDLEQPLLIGSVKTNFGHLESAAGVAGLMKVLLSMNRGVIPKHLNFHNPTPVVDWEKLPIRVTSKATAWPVASDRPLMAGVSGYGWSGTNAHVVLEGYGSPKDTSAEPYRHRLPVGSRMRIGVSTGEEATDSAASQGLAARTARMLPLSGKTSDALKELAGRYLTWLDENGSDVAPEGSAGDTLLSDMAWTAGVGRSRFDHRVGLVFRDAASLRNGLKEVVDGGSVLGEGTASKAAFVYTGQGAQWFGMGETLYETEPVARAVLDRCEQAMLEERGKSLLDVIFDRESAEGDLYETAWAQPATYALQCALTALWRSVGVDPYVVIGHSTGEFAAAQAADVFGLEDGLKFMARRGVLLSAVPDLGTMAAIFAPEEKVAEAVREYNATSDGTDLVIAVDNGIHQVISGQTVAVNAVCERFEAEEVTVRRLTRNQAFHSPLLEPALDELEEEFRDAAISPPSVNLVSNVTGSVVAPDEALDAKYWRRHAREAVQFRKGIGALSELGVDVVIEVGPHAVLGPLVSLVWSGVSDGSRDPVVLESMIRPPRDEDPSEYEDSFMKAVAGAYEAGLPISFHGLFAGEERCKIELPGYPFQRERHWIDMPKRRRASSGDPLMGIRHESPRGEVMFETEMLASDPAWLNDHRVFGHVIMPGALYGAMAAAVSLNEGAPSVNVEDLQLHSPMIFVENDDQDGVRQSRRIVQAILCAPENGSVRRLEIFSKGDSEDGWTLHADCKVSLGAGAHGSTTRIDIDGVKAGLTARDVSGFYRSRAEVGIGLGPLFRTLQGLWSADGEAIGEIVLPEVNDANGVALHPVLLDGCFQVLSAARHSAGGEDEVTYLPFGWERLWFGNSLPERLICHARFRDDGRNSEVGAVPEVMSGDLAFYTTDGVEVGGLSGYTVKRATRAALLSATEGLQDLLYEIVWRDSALADGMPSADFLASPMTVASDMDPFSAYLESEGVEAAERAELLSDLERLSQSFTLAALERLGWKRETGTTITPDDMRLRLNIIPEHRRLLDRLLAMLSEAGVLTPGADGAYKVSVGAELPLPDESLDNPDKLVSHLERKHPHGLNELGLLRRCGSALADVLRGQTDPLALLFPSEGTGAADLYRDAPAARAANRMLRDSVAAIVSDMPEDRRLRVLEVGAGTGSATAWVLPELPEEQFDYTYTDISAGFFSEAESRFGDGDGSIEYRVLDIEKDPLDQGFDAHGYDLVIAANVLHATLNLGETLAHCGDLLAPAGQLIALEGTRGRGWQDLTFGLLDGWWRFADAYRPNHALASPPVWRQVLQDTGFGDVEFLGAAAPVGDGPLGSSVIIAQGPEEVDIPAGTWIIAADSGGVAEDLAAELSGRNQTVALAISEARSSDQLAEKESRIIRASVEIGSRESWRSLIESLPGDAPLSGVIHMVSLDGHGADATAGELAEDTRQAGESALALVQGIADADAATEKGVWFITRGGQVLERERQGELSGAMLWGFGKVMARETPRLSPRMIDLDPDRSAPLSDLVNELLYPDNETHIAYRLGLRQAARLVRSGMSKERLTLPEESRWFLQPDPDGALESLQVSDLPERPLEPGEVRIAVDAAGLNFKDVLIAMNALTEDSLGFELCGRVLEVGSEVSGVSVGDRVVALAFGAFGSEAVVREELLAPAPPNVPTAALATMPLVFVTTAMSFDLASLKSGERVLIHAGAGGVGLAAIQLALAAGAEVFATASAPKRAYLRSLGVKHVFDSRQTKFAREILEATGGKGVDVVLNSLTGEGFIEASLSCLAQGGRFIELARLDIYSEEEMAAARPDVEYHILEVDSLKRSRPDQPGAILRDVMKRTAAGELEPLIHSRWSMAEVAPAMNFMRAARHVGKLVLANSPLETGRLRGDRTYLVTGGLGGIGCALAGQLADRGAGAIVLNGRRPPDPEAEEAIEALRERGVRVKVELADVTDTAAVDAMLARIDADLLPLAGVIHSVGVLSDAALINQSWDSFEQVLWPKMLGAWHLHRATMDRDLDMFVLFSSVAGVMGNPGQANHAAANAFLDQLAGHRRALGLPGQAIAWGAWSELGEAAEQRERIERQLEAEGTGWITPGQGLQAFEMLVRQDVASGMVAAVDWSRYGGGQVDAPPFLDELLSISADDAVETEESTDDLLSQLSVSRQTDPESVLVSFLQKELQAVMRLPTTPSPSVGFFDLGMDSLMAVEFRNRLNRAFAGEYVVSNTAVFDYPDIATLTGHLSEELGQIAEDDETPPTPETVVPEPRPAVGAEDDDIAIVGMACRFPQAKDLSEYWQLLESGKDAITDRRRNGDEDQDGENARYLRGAFLDDIEWFDSRFFRIAPIEARTMDPQQRMMLETSWEALEDAGIDPDGLRGSRTGVYGGVVGSEYRELIDASGQLVSHLGTTSSVAVGRIAFALGLEGPAMAIDMACASSLAAIHQAAASLRRGEVDMALAGGVQVVLSRAVSRHMAQVGMLSLTGQCRPFDAAADGYVRGEGCGIVVLKRLSDAEADGDRIWGVIRGSAVNQNGASAGLTVPNGSAQERVMEEALAQAGISGADVDYLEAHATGSQLGDAIEMRAVGAVYGKGREPGRPLLAGTVKSNIGHLEAAAGIAGLIKTVLAMKQGVIPKHLHFENPNPQIEWDQMPVRVTSDNTEWPLHPYRPPRAAVSAFGVSGTNSHVVLEGYGRPPENPGANGGMRPFAGPARPIPASPTESDDVQSPADEELAARETRLLPLSGKSQGAIRDLAKRYTNWIDERADELSLEADAAPVLADMAWTSGVGRSHLPHRVGVVFRDVQSLRDGLRTFVEAEDAPDDTQPQTATKVAFLYTGEGSEWVGMGEGLYDTEPVVRAVLDRCDAVVRDERGASLLDVMFGRAEADGTLADPSWSQPAIYALECALTALWSSVGISPNVALGDGLGELSAAQAAEVFSIEDGLRLVLARGTEMADVVVGRPSLDMVSGKTGQVVESADEINGVNWSRQTREPVKFDACVQTLAKLGVDIVVEIGPGSALGQRVILEWPESPDGSEAAPSPVVLASLARPSDGEMTEASPGFVEAVSKAYESGLVVSLDGMFAGESRRRISLPSYPFQRRWHWV